MTAVAPVSAVIPCFRCARTLERAVESVIAQTVPPMEVILVDDCSGDATRALMEQLQRRCEPDWIRLVFLEVNAGAASARNAGWDLARGDYVAFLDADDAWHPRKIEVQYKYMNSNPFVTPSFMVRRDIAQRFMIGRRYMEDHLFLMQVALSGGLIAKGNCCLAYIFKPIYGQSGLSSNMYQMQISDLDNYRCLRSIGRISILEYVLLSIYSCVKFFKRLLVVGSMRLVRYFH
jgi:glycosyltransferase involved in cell wall biosynthesis